MDYRDDSTNERPVAPRPQVDLQPSRRTQAHPATSNFGSLCINPGWALLEGTQADALRHAEEYRRTHGDPIANLASIMAVDPEDVDLLFDITR